MVLILNRLAATLFEVKHYKVDQIIAKGSFGVVYHAHVDKVNLRT